MEIVAEYDIENVHPNGCLGVQVGSKMYVDSGGGTPTNTFGADVYAFPVTGFSPANPPNTPAPKVVLSLDAGQEHDEGPDAHGATLTQQQRRLWVADRGRNLIWVFDTRSDELLNEIHLEGQLSDDPTPDLLQTSPDGQYVFMSLRGPNPLTADPHVSTGSTPGVGVIKVTAAAGMAGSTVSHRQPISTPWESNAPTHMHSRSEWCRRSDTDTAERCDGGSTWCWAPGSPPEDEILVGAGFLVTGSTVFRPRG